MKTEIIKHVIGIEGGYSDHKNDPGGKTQFGITEAVARSHGYDGPMNELPVDLAVSIYEKDYWDALSLDSILAVDPAIAFELFDSGVNAGIGRAGRWLQEALNQFNRQGRDYDDLRKDGDVGAKTVAALEALVQKRGTVGKRVVWRALNCLQGYHYLSLPEKFESFKVGWFDHRVDELPSFIKEA